MESSTKLQDIDKKIKELQDKKKQLEQRQLEDISKLVKRVGAAAVPVEILLGGLEEIVKLVKDKDAKIIEWEQAGKDKMKKMSKSKGGEEASSSFPDSAD